MQHFYSVSGRLCGQKFSGEKDEKDSDGGSSVCEELIEEPDKEEIANKEHSTNEDRFVRITVMTAK